MLNQIPSFQTLSPKPFKKYSDYMYVEEFQIKISGFLVCFRHKLTMTTAKT